MNSIRALFPQSNIFFPLYPLKAIDKASSFAASFFQKIPLLRSLPLVQTRPLMAVALGVASSAAVFFAIRLLATPETKTTKKPEPETTKKPAKAEVPNLTKALIEASKKQKIPFTLEKKLNLDGTFALLLNYDEGKEAYAILKGCSVPTDRLLRDSQGFKHELPFCMLDPISSDIHIYQPGLGRWGDSIGFFADKEGARISYESGEKINL